MKQHYKHSLSKLLISNKYLHLIRLVTNTFPLCRRIWHLSDIPTTTKISKKVIANKTSKREKKKQKMLVDVTHSSCSHFKYLVAVLSFKLFSGLLSFQHWFSVWGPNSLLYILRPPVLQTRYFLETTYPLGSFCHYSAASEDVLCSKQNTFHLS